MSRKATGVNTGSVEVSPDKQRRIKRAMRAQEKRWAKKAGPVTVRFECPICGGAHPKAEHDVAHIVKGTDRRV